MKDTKIEWCDHTFNPWEGCTKVSPGCANCYAEARNNRWAGGANWGPGAPRRRTSEANWRQPLKWNRDCEDHPIPAHLYNRRPRVFCASLADWLDDEVPIEWLADLLDLIRRTPNLDWLLLTKRPENWRHRLYHVLTHGYSGTNSSANYSFVDSWYKGTPPANVWIGTTVEDQKRADERIPALLQIPALVRFLSCEPLLGPVNVSTRLWITNGYGEASPDFEAELGIHWVICGGESGPNARPMHPDWARSLRRQCEAAGVPFLFKQWGEWAPYQSRDEYTEQKPLTCMKPCGELSWWAGNEDTTINYSTNYEETDQPIERVGKSAAGRLLDGREWSQFPEVKP